MADVSKISKGITLSAQADLGSAQRTGEAIMGGIETGLRSKMNTTKLATDFGTQFNAALNKALALDPAGQLERKLLSLANSVSRGRIDDAVERQILRQIGLAEKLGLTLQAAYGQSLHGVFQQMTAPRQSESTRYQAALQRQEALNGPMMSSDAENYQYKLIEMADRQRAVEQQREHARQKGQSFQLSLHNDQRAAADLAAEERRNDAVRYQRTLQSQSMLNDPHVKAASDYAAYQAKLQSQQILNNPHVRIAPPPSDWAAYQAKLQSQQILNNPHVPVGDPITDHRNRVRGAIQTGYNAQIHSQNDMDDAAFQQANNRRMQMLRQMAGPSASLLQGVPGEDHMLGNSIRARAFAHAGQHDAVTQAQAAYQVYQMNNPRTAGTGAGAGAGAAAGGMSRYDSHRFRFASQNLAFGIDDAIQSYHYGGVGASIRAASNNATAIAGMAITNPTTAAASVIGLSVVSALAPLVIKAMMGNQTQLDDKKAFEASEKGRYGYNISAKRGGRGLFDKVQSDILEAGTASESSLEESGQLDKQIKIKARELTHHYERSSTFDQFLMGVDAFMGGGELGEIDDLKDKKKANTQARLEARKKKEAAEARYDQAIRIAGEERELNTLDAVQGRATDNTLRSGGFADGGGYAASLQLNAQKKIDSITASSASHDSKKFRTDAIRMDLADRLADRGRLDMDVLDANRGHARERYSEARQHMSSLQGFSGDNGRVGKLKDWRESYNKELTERRAETDHKFAMGGSAADRDESRRLMGIEVIAAQKHLNRSHKRAVEDDLEDLDPERNPLKRQERLLSRLSEDLALRTGLSDSERTDQARAALTAAERRRDEFMNPLATSFISKSTVGSADDEELRARLTGHFGPVRQQNDNSGLTLSQINEKMTALLQQLHLEAQTLGH